MEFGGFIGGFGKIFFTKGGVKREKEDFRGWRGKGKFIFFLKFSKGGGEEFEILWGNVFLGFWGGEGERKGGKDRGIGLCMGRDVIWNIP